MCRKYPESELLEALQLTVEEAEKCQTVVHQLCTSNQKAKTRGRGVDAKYRLTVEELQLFANQLETLPARVSCQEGVTELLDNVAKFQANAERLLDLDNVMAEEVEKCLDMTENMDIDLPEINRLRNKLEQVNWLAELAELFEDPNEVTIEAVKRIKLAGERLPSNNQLVVQKLAHLAGLLVNLEGWEAKASACLASRPRVSLAEAERLVTDGEIVSPALPSLNSLKVRCSGSSICVCILFCRSLFL